MKPSNDICRTRSEAERCSVLIVLALLFLSAGNLQAKPKYGPQAVRLWQSHEYIRTHEAPDYWALSPYYIPQQDDRSCSLASVVMLVNAARYGRTLSSSDRLATQKDLLDKVDPKPGDFWRRALGPSGRGVTLDELKPLIEASLKTYGIRDVSVEIVHADAGDPDARKRLQEALIQNEKSSDNFLLVNFIQGIYTGDAKVGHIAPIAAYDESRQRVLVMDPDREWYEPYWVSEATLLSGMTTIDPESRLSRGYVFVRIGK